MKNKDIIIGRVYTAKVSGSLQPIKITGHHTRYSGEVGGFDGLNLNTRRKVYIKSARRLRYGVPEDNRPETIKPWGMK